ncbi:MAG: hypothetical protein ABUS47_00230 [Steroidobacter sp.]
MKDYLPTLLKKISKYNLDGNASVIPWASPVPVFGPVETSRVGTLGLNPSNREFVDVEGNELSGMDRRFHTLTSLGLKNWNRTKDSHIEKISSACERYFNVNPYNTWFQELDVIINDIGSSYYGNNVIDACHLDLIPYATYKKWTDLAEGERQLLLHVSGQAFALILRESLISLLVLNGMSVIRHLESVADVELEVQEMPEWTLSRRNSEGVKGFAFKGAIQRIGDVDLNRKISVIGFNHNLQSSFGVTKQVKSSIRKWIGETGRELLA